MVEILPHRDSDLVTVRVDGGNRRSRAAHIGNAIRGRGWTRIGTRYSETYGFQTRTELIYRISA